MNITDNQLIERPKCENPNCEEYGLVFVGSHCFCGQCALRVLQENDKKTMQVFEAK